MASLWRGPTINRDAQVVTDLSWGIPCASFPSSSTWTAFSISSCWHVACKSHTPPLRFGILKQAKLTRPVHRLSAIAHSQFRENIAYMRLTVSSVTISSSAIAWLEVPRSSRWSTSCSRLLNGSGNLCGCGSRLLVPSDLDASSSVSR